MQPTRVTFGIPTMSGLTGSEQNPKPQQYFGSQQNPNVAPTKNAPRFRACTPPPSESDNQAGAASNAAKFPKPVPGGIARRQPPNAAPSDLSDAASDLAGDPLCRELFPATPPKVEQQYREVSPDSSVNSEYRLFKRHSDRRPVFGAVGRDRKHVIPVAENPVIPFSNSSPTRTSRPPHTREAKHRDPKNAGMGLRAAIQKFKQDGK